MQEDRPTETVEPSISQGTEQASEKADSPQQPEREYGESNGRHGDESPESGVSARRIDLYSGLFVLALQLLYVYSFFPTYDEAMATLEGVETAEVSAPVETEGETALGDTRPDFLQWSGAHSLVWLASLFVPRTPVRHLPAIFFFLIMGGFFASIYHPPYYGRVLSTVLVSARNGVLLWVSWLAGAVILLVYLLTSSGGMQALDATAAITFKNRWEGIVETFMAHWLVYVAWFAFLALLPMFGGGVLGLIRTRLLTARSRYPSKPEWQALHKGKAREWIYCGIHAIEQGHEQDQGLTLRGREYDRPIR